MIRIATSDLVAVLTDLALTTAAEDGAYPTLAAVMLFTDRGYPVPDEPGRSDILVGMSTNRRIGAQSYVPCEGQMTPMLWPVSKAAQVIAVFKPKLKGNKEHGVIIERDGEHVRVQEDPNLFDDGDRIEFKQADLGDYPGYGLAQTIAEMPMVATTAAQKPRTDFYPADLAALAKIATRRNEPIETYRTHQDHRVLVKIGYFWRGWIKPVPFEQGRPSKTMGYAPESEAFRPPLDVGEEDEKLMNGYATPPASAPVDEDMLPLAPETVS